MKHAFGVEITCSRFKNLVSHTLNEDAVTKRGYFGPKKVNRLLENTLLPASSSSATKSSPLWFSNSGAARSSTRTTSSIKLRPNHEEARFPTNTLAHHLDDVDCRHASGLVLRLCELELLPKP